MDVTGEELAMLGEGILIKEKLILLAKDLQEMLVQEVKEGDSRL